MILRRASLTARVMLTRAFRRRSHPPYPPAEAKSTGEFVGEKVNLNGELFTPAQIMKVPCLGQFLL